MDKMLLAAAHLPDTLIWLLPMLIQPIEQALEILPQVVRDGIVAIIDVDRIQHLSVDVQLLLLIRSIADAYGSAVAIARQVIERGFGEYLFSFHAVHWL